MNELVNITYIKALYPDEWVLLGNPEMDESKIDVLSGVPIYHGCRTSLYFVAAYPCGRPNIGK